METPDFIEVYERAIEPSVCAELLTHFDASPKLRRGATTGGVNTNLKDSWDLDVSGNPEWKNAENLFNNAMLSCLMAYVRKFPYLALAPTALFRQTGAGERTMLGAADIVALQDPELQRLVVQLFRPGRINMQRYFANEGGYPYWHSETSPKRGDMDNLHRVLLWTVYLNDDFEEGETEFFHQQRKITPKTGSLLIAPAGFTHTHRGNQPKSGNKYIATSWILFQPAEVLYADPTQGQGAAR
ncbi:2OG-Fe(II) oxygenase [Dokdonella sp.]|uniref:2OG-Fe(II) oxygenase n=1 Tax=Dokdonella sp. TaxID=2291710 RepID=UPI0031C2F536|nr:2OG-Fe(II) oxygenase [Dokdonella sp.]